MGKIVFFILVLCFLCVLNETCFSFDDINEDTTFKFQKKVYRSNIVFPIAIEVIEIFNPPYIGYKVEEYRVYVFGITFVFDSNRLMNKLFNK